MDTLRRLACAQCNGMNTVMAQRNYPPRLDVHPQIWKDMMLNVDWMTFYLCEQGNFNYRQDGSDWKVAGLCPFHADKRPGSFYINSESGCFKCHSCGTGGNAVDFVVWKYGLEVKESLKYIGENGCP